MSKKLIIKILVFLGFLTLTGIIASGAFYWYELRPAKIKRDCSWISTHHDKTLAKSPKTEEEVFAESNLSREDFNRALGLARGDIKPRSSVNASGNTDWKSFSENFDDNRLRTIGQEAIKKMQGSAEIPASAETRKAKQDEYTFCLHDKGL